MSYGNHQSWTPALAPAPRGALLTGGVLGRRIWAFLVDGLILAVLCGALWVALLAFGLLTLGLGLPLLGALPAVPLLYNWLSVASAGSATPGQRLLGLTVRRDADLGQPTPLEALIWTLGFMATMALGAIWFGFALLTVRHRTLHDLVSGLVVVRRRSLEEALTSPAAVWDASRGGTRYV